MNVDLIALLNKPLFPKLLSAFWGILLLLLLVQSKSVFLPSNEQDIAVLNQHLEEPHVQKALNIPLFGHYLAVDDDSEGMKQSMLAFEVIGIMYASQASNSQVLIRLSDGDEHSYMVGDQLPGGAVIKHIKPDSVVILYQGALEVLKLPKNTLQFDEPAKPLFKE